MSLQQAFVNEIPHEGLLAQVKMEMAELKESSSQSDNNLSCRKDSRLSSQIETSPSYLFWHKLNPNTSVAQKTKDSFTETKANSSTRTLHHLEQQQKQRCHIIPEEAQHYDIGPLLSRMDKRKSSKRPKMTGLSVASKNCESDAGANELSLLESSPSVVFDDPTVHITDSNVRKKPRLANTNVPYDPQVSEENCTEELSPLTNSLKRLSEEELERIIMGHMTGYVTTYKPYVDMERELDSCKEMVERFRQKNNLLSKEVADLRIVVKSFVTQSATRFERPTKRFRSVGVQVKPSISIGNIKSEKNDFQADSNRKKSEESRSVLPKHVAPQFERKGELSSIAARSVANIPQKECKDTEQINVEPRSMKNRTEEAKVEDDDLKVMFIKPSNPIHLRDSTAEDPHPITSSSKVSDHPEEPILPKPLVTVTKTSENSMPAIRIVWEIPEKPRYAKVASYCVFLLKETRIGSGKSWDPITGEISRTSCTFRVGRADKLRSSYQFKVRATDTHGRYSPFSDVVVANFP